MRWDIRDVSKSTVQKNNQTRTQIKLQICDPLGWSETLRWDPIDSLSESALIWFGQENLTYGNNHKHLTRGVIGQTGA